MSWEDNTLITISPSVAKIMLEKSTVIGRTNNIFHDKTQKDQKRDFHSVAGILREIGRL